jgi:hypothetical protein
MEILYPAKKAAEWVNGRMLTIPDRRHDGTQKQRPGRPVLDNLTVTARNAHALTYRVGQRNLRKTLDNQEGKIIKK